MARGIYKIINVVNNKFYVGSAVSFKRRKARHVWRLQRGDHANKHLQAAWNLYGEKAFVFVMVEEVPEDKDLLAAENVWLYEHVGKEYCYNIATDAVAPTRGWIGEKNPMWGKTYTHTEEAKKKIGAASKARVQTEEEKAKRSKTMMGHAVSTATREKLSAAASGENNPWYGKKRPDHGAKVSKALVAIKPDGTEEVHTSILGFLNTSGLNPPTIHRALKSGKPLTRGPFVGWAFKYLDPSP